VERRSVGGDGSDAEVTSTIMGLCCMAMSSTASTAAGMMEARFGRVRRNHQRRTQRWPMPTSMPSNMRINVGPIISRMGRWAPAEAAPKKAAANKTPSSAPNNVETTGRISGMPASSYDFWQSSHHSSSPATCIGHMYPWHAEHLYA
jgi:hypothetical protein